MSKVFNKPICGIIGISLIALSASVSASVSPEVITKQQATETVSAGTLELYSKFPSDYVNDRRIQVWLPEDYTNKTQYAVVYMHDGQMLFDASVTWNGQEWMVDEVAGKLSQRDDIKPFIVVGVDNGGNHLRHSEYFPEKPFLSIAHKQRQEIMKGTRSGGDVAIKQRIFSDDYLKFLVYELKPFIDQNYSVLSDKDNTFVIGSSMGGLISMYAMLEYPNVFGGAGCMSTHWPGIFTVDNNPIPDAFNEYLAEHLGSVVKQKLYFDYGDKTLDKLYPPLQKKVDATMATFGVSGSLWQTHFFPGANHSEQAWQKRLHIPFEFLLKKQ